MFFFAISIVWKKLTSIIFSAEIAAAYYEPDETLKQKKLDDLNKEMIPFYLKKLDAAAKENNGYLALGRVSLSIEFHFHRKQSNFFIFLTVDLR